MKTLDGREQENFYDGEGLRAGMTENGRKTTFLYHNGEILAECDGESAPIKRHIRGIGLSYVQTIQDNIYHSYHQDEQGSTAYITGQNNVVENCYQYDAFGNLIEKHEDVNNRILYTGQQYDQETGQYYLRARYYNPVVGRFLQEDTYRGDGLNLYAYCANNPVMYYDPSGHSIKSWFENLCKKVAEFFGDDTPGEEIVNKDGAGAVEFNIDEIRPQLRTEPDTAFFWSGKTDGVGGAKVAADIAEGKGGVTLELTIEKKNIMMPTWDFSDPSSMDAWDMASAAYAEQVSGEVRAVVGTELRSGNIWENVELPRLMENPNVTKITIIDPKTGKETDIFER